jgi:hypothetical protein
LAVGDAYAKIILGIEAMTFFDENGNPIQCQKWLNIYERYYFLNGPTWGRRFTRAYQSSRFVEDEIWEILRRGGSLSENDLIRIMAWKIGAIDHPASEGARRIIYRYDWDQRLTNRYKKDFSRSIRRLVKMMPTILDELDRGRPQHVFDLVSGLENFGPVYALTILFFITHGREPIYDKFAHVAAGAILQNLRPESSVTRIRAAQTWADYENYIALVSRIASTCEPRADSSGIFVSRRLDRALWVYGHLFTTNGNNRISMPASSQANSVRRQMAQGSAYSGTTRCIVIGMRQYLANGLERCVLYVCPEFRTSVPCPPFRERWPITLATPRGSFHAGLRVESSTSDRPYVCPDLVAYSGNRRTNLAEVFRDCNIRLGQEIDVRIDGATWTIIDASD